MSDPFDPADASHWLARGRDPDHAAAIAAAWQALPDLPASAPLAERMARTRARVAVMRPVNDAIRDYAEAERQRTNFAFTVSRVAAGRGDARERHLLHARDAHGYDWDAAVGYAQGRYAAEAGWTFNDPAARRGAPPPADPPTPYARGFADGGGIPGDLFDAARRANLATAPEAEVAAIPHAGRPLPSSWPSPTDRPRPARWDRRLLILSAREAWKGADPTAFDGAFLRRLGTIPGTATTLVLLIGEAGFIDADTAVPHPPTRPSSAAVAALAASGTLRAQLAALLAGREIDEVLVAAQGEWLAIIDAHAAALPLCRTMERTRNTPLQEKAQFATWLARGFTPGTSIGSGHIRWGKAAKGLSAALGEFTVRHTGPAVPRGHRVEVQLAGGALAYGYADGGGMPLAPVATVSAKAKLRPAMAALLRQFGGATRLAAAGADPSSRRAAR